MAKEGHVLVCTVYYTSRSYFSATAKLQCMSVYFWVFLLKDSIQQFFIKAEKDYSYLTWNRYNHHPNGGLDLEWTWKYWASNCLNFEKTKPLTHWMEVPPLPPIFSTFEPPKNYQTLNQKFLLHRMDNFPFVIWMNLKIWNL